MLGVVGSAVLGWLLLPVAMALTPIGLSAAEAVRASTPAAVVSEPATTAASTGADALPVADATAAHGDSGRAEDSPAPAEDSPAPAEDGHADAAHHQPPPGWSVLPFVVLLVAIAGCPLVVPHFWHHHYGKVAVGLGLVTVVHYLVGMHQGHVHLLHAGIEYVEFICLLAGLFMAAGGIVVRVNRRSTPVVNVALLACGAVLANVIATTGAAMLLIRPFMAVNQGRLKPFHIVFFIFIVANIGGALSPIGDPPLFLGFLKGIDFFLFFRLNAAAWLLALACLLTIFFVLDSRCGPADPELAPTVDPAAPSVSLRGGRNLIFLAIVVGSVFLDPNKMTFLPVFADVRHGEVFAFGFTQSGLAERLAADHGPLGPDEVVYVGFVREVIQLGVGLLAFKLARRDDLAANGFSFEPIKEVAVLFIGIFLTMTPALAIIKHQAMSGSLFGIPLTPTTFYFATGTLSGVLDNAPTFLSFLAGLEGKVQMTAAQISQTITSGALEPALVSELTASFTAARDAAVASGKTELAATYAEVLAQLQPAQQADFVALLRSSLLACGVASVFWGAMTYIGNGPNFMIKAIADSAVDADGRKLVDCPSFFSYVIRYSIPVLLPVLVLVWLVFLSGVVL